MSFDLAVWPSSAVKSNKEASDLYQTLCEDLPSIYDALPNNVSIDEFYNELTAMHPEIDDIPEEQIDNSELCPWSVAFDRSDKHILMCAVWSRAEYVESLIRRLGKKHNLAVYDPQSERLHLPDDNKKRWWQFWR